MSEATELLAVIDAVIGVLRRHHVLYFVTGSFASSVHGEFRATNDLDLVAQIDPGQLAPLFDDLSRDFIADIEQARDTLASGTSFNLIHRTTFLKVDVFPCTSAFDRVAAERAETIVVPGAAEPLRVATKEDILLAKLRWYRRGAETSETQRRDIERLVSLNRGEFDDAYLRSGAAQLQVTDLLQRLFE